MTAEEKAERLGKLAKRKTAAMDRKRRAETYLARAKRELTEIEFETYKIENAPTEPAGQKR